MQYRPRTLLIVLALGPPLLAGCTAGDADPTSGKPNLLPPAAEAALLSATEFELLSLDPLQLEADGEDRFHRWLVLGKTVIGDREAKVRIIAALRKSITKYDDGRRALCFWPRHGIRVRDAEHTYDFVICFECHAAGIHIDGQEPGSFLQISRVKPSPQLVLDDELVRAGIPLPKKPID